MTTQEAEALGREIATAEASKLSSDELAILVDELADPKFGAFGKGLRDALVAATKRTQNYDRN